MTTKTAVAPIAKTEPAPVVRLGRRLFRPGATFNLLLAIENDDNARAAIRVTAALTGRGAVPTVIHATELMTPVAGTPDSMMFFAEAVLGEEFHEGLARFLDALISSTTSGAQTWPVLSVTGEPAFSITQEAAARNSDLVVMGIHQHGAFEQAIGENTATRVMARSPVPVLGVRPGLSGLPRRIMVPTDFGDASREAAHLAANLADPGGTVVLVHASLPLPLVEEGDEGAALIQREGIEHAFLHLTDEISEGKSIQVETVSRTGDKGSELMKAAALVSPDVICIASQRHHLITRLLLGSVTRKLVREGSWSMLITAPARSQPKLSPELR
jgi:nucleotide-binding universal stress UspA family protein